MILSRRRRPDARQKFLPAIFLLPIVVAKFIFFAPNLLFLRIWQQWISVARTLQISFLYNQILHNDCSHIEDVHWRHSSRAEFGHVFKRQ